MERIIGAVLALLMLIGNASALGISSTSFIDVELPISTGMRKQLSSFPDTIKIIDMFSKIRM